MDLTTPKKTITCQLLFLHEVGGHAYNFSNSIYGSSNNRNTEAFEQTCRAVFKGLFGNTDIRCGEVKRLKW